MLGFTGLDANLYVSSWLELHYHHNCQCSRGFQSAPLLEQLVRHLANQPSFWAKRRIPHGTSNKNLV